MKIFHLITTLERGGAENQLVTLVREQIRDNNQVFVGYLKGKPELVTELEKMSATVLSEVSNLALILQIFKIRKIINKLEPDIIHAHLPRAELISSLIKGKTKLILSKHNSETFWPGVNARLSRYLSKFTLTPNFLYIFSLSLVELTSTLNSVVFITNPKKLIKYLSLTTNLFK